MFAPHCPTCATRVLLGPARVVHLVTGPEGRHVVVLRCRCGGLVTWDSRQPARTGAAASALSTDAPVAADAVLAAASADT